MSFETNYEYNITTQYTYGVRIIQESFHAQSININQVKCLTWGQKKKKKLNFFVHHDNFKNLDSKYTNTFKINNLKNNNNNPLGIVFRPSICW